MLTKASTTASMIKANSMAASVLGRERDPCRKYRIGTVVVASTPAAEIPQRCRGRMRGANALCDLGCLRIGAAKPHQQTKWAGKSGTMTNAPVAAWALSGTCGG